MKRRNRKKAVFFIAAAILAAAAGISYGAEDGTGPGMGLVRTEDGRTEREEITGETAGTPEVAGTTAEAPGETSGTSGETAAAFEVPAGTAGGELPAAVPEYLPDRDVLSDPEIAADTDQIIVVRGQGGASVRAAYYQESDGVWSQVFETSGVWGLNGCSAEKREGDKKTPVGVYRFNMAFGILDDPGTVFPYHKVRETDYWVDDPDSVWYNRMVDASQVEKGWDSAEHLIEVDPYYNYALSLTYNEEAVPGKGSAIFLHCTTEGYAGSSGCICIPEPEMKQIIRQADEKTKIVILES